MTLNKVKRHHVFLKLELFHPHRCHFWGGVRNGHFMGKWEEAKKDERGATATRPTLWAPTSSGPVRSHSRNLRASQDMPRSSPGSLATHLSSLRRGRSECCRPGRLQASGARSSPRLAGPPPGTAQTWSARHLHSWLCTANNTRMSHPGLLGFGGTPSPRLLKVVSLRLWVAGQILD